MKSGQTTTLAEYSEIDAGIAALKKILEVCHTETWSHAIKVRRITTIAEANLRGKSSKP